MARSAGPSSRRAPSPARTRRRAGKSCRRCGTTTISSRPCPRCPTSLRPRVATIGTGPARSRHEPASRPIPCPPPRGPPTTEPSRRKRRPGSGPPAVAVHDAGDGGVARAPAAPRSRGKRPSRPSTSPEGRAHALTDPSLPQAPEPLVHLELEVNGERRPVTFATYKTLLEVLREDLRLTGTKHGCE